jgi:hypothetical protein
MQAAHSIRASQQFLRAVFIQMPEESVGSLSFEQRGSQRRGVVFFAAWREKATGFYLQGV